MQASANGETFFVDVDTLQEHGISAQDIAKLKASGVATIKGVQQGEYNRNNVLSDSVLYIVSNLILCLGSLFIYCLNSHSEELVQDQGKD